LVLAGCAKKATWVRNDLDGYTLVAHVENVEQALIRFRRTANELCPSAAYEMSDPQVIDRENHANLLGGGGTMVTLETHLKCTRASP